MGVHDPIEDIGIFLSQLIHMRVWCRGNTTVLQTVITGSTPVIR